MASEKESPSDNAAREEQFLRKMHVHYYVKQLAVLPFEYVMLDTSRLTAIYFCVVGLDMLGALDLIKKDVIIDFIYGMQLTPAVASKEVFCGFVGSSFLGQGFQVNDTAKDCGCSDSPIAGHLGQYTQGHIAMTYCAICVLLTLGDDLSRLDRTGLAKGMWRRFPNEKSCMLSFCIRTTQKGLC
jgi:geranylgeranyl transferase type-1 subunit beta